MNPLGHVPASASILAIALTKSGQIPAGRSLTVFKGGGDYKVVVDFDAWATDLVRGRRWHATQEFTELPDGTSRLRLRLDNIEEMKRWVLSWGAHATVVRPKELARRIQRTATTLVERYRKMEPA